MAKFKIIGFIDEVQSPEMITDKFTKQVIIVRIPPYRDQLQVEKGKEEHWKLDLSNDKIREYELDRTNVGMAGEFEFYANSYKVPNKSTPDDPYFISNYNLKSIKWMP